MAEIIRARQAKSDLQRIWRYIARDSEPAATRLLARIDKRILQLAAFPESGSAQDDIKPGMRLLAIAGYRVLYEFDATLDRVRIIAVVEPYRE